MPIYSLYKLVNKYLILNKIYLWKLLILPNMIDKFINIK